MRICDELNKECNNYREPCSAENRGGYTATSVTGTGPGKYCPKPPPDPVIPTPPLKNSCKISVVVGGTVFYNRGQLKNIKTC
jgi:hypothetical protein